MCGIAGMLGLEDRALGRAMGQRLAHRGPDGSGVWNGQGTTLVHQRLAILDVAHGEQPMVDSTGRYTLVYNGECYNHQELRGELEALGVDFRTGTDSETVLEGYRVWGHEVLGRMEGMYALAIHDQADGSVFLARDPWGIKPLFYTRTHDTWLFASEQKALFAHPDVAAVEDQDRIKERAGLEFLTGQGTLFAGIHQLPPGTWARLQADQDCLSWEMHYQVPAVAFGSVEDAARSIRDRFVHSVREQLLSDVPLGVVLSGGLDSAAVAVVHQSLVDDPIQTFTVAESEEVADLQAARSLADHLGTDHHETFFDVEDMWSTLPKWTHQNENINYTEFFFEPLFARMRRDVTVGLCGQGSDELWGGYGRYQDPAALASTRLARLRRSRPRHLEDVSAQIAMTHISGSALSEWDQQGQLANFQLRLVDRNSMAHGLEVRVPFLSRPLHAASRAAPWDWKVREGMEKWILRKGLADLGLQHALPEDLLWRRKVPAGRATGPKVVEAFEKQAAGIVDPREMARHPLGASFDSPAEFLVYRLWHHIHIEHRGTLPQVRLEDVA